MKKTINAIIAAMIVMCLLVFCKKEDKDSGVVNQTTQKLLGRWTFLNSTSNDYYSDADHVKVTPGQQGDYIEFRSGGTAIVRLLGASDTSKFSVTKDNKVIFDQVDVFDLKTLSESDLILYRKVVYTAANYSEETYTLKR
jgi:hypothetical protein